MSESVNKELLAKIASGEVKFVSAAEGMPLLQHSPRLIDVDQAQVDPTDGSKVACRVTADAAAYLANGTAKPVNGEASKYAIISNAILPEAKKRGGTSGSGAPTKYPFADMEVGHSFFSANSEHAKGDAVKALGSTISSQNRKYATQKTDEAGKPLVKSITRAVRDKKTHKALLNADGTKQEETVDLPVLDYARKFTIRPVEAGKVYGGWTAPADGALVARVK